jgi:hypothetical protein
MSHRNVTTEKVLETVSVRMICECRQTLRATGWGDLEIVCPYCKRFYNVRTRVYDRTEAQGLDNAVALYLEGMEVIK